MKAFVALILTVLLTDYCSSMTHTLRHFQTSSSQVPNFPESVQTVEVNDVEIMYCDSQTWRVEPKYKWLDRVAEAEAFFWRLAAQICASDVQWGKFLLEAAKPHLNQTEGVHVVQNVFSCDWDNETDKSSGSFHYGFDGEDVLSFDLRTRSWVISKSEVFTSLRNLSRQEGESFFVSDYHLCLKYLKNVVAYGEKTLMRTELPLVSLLQKSSSSPVTCHATGFFPDRAQLFWTKDGHEVWEEVDVGGETLPNGDGTFQISMNLNLSSVPPEDWDRYECVFRLSGVKEDLVTRLERDKIRTNAKSATNLDLLIGLPVGVTITLSIIITVALLVIRRKKTSTINIPFSPSPSLGCFNLMNCNVRHHGSSDP
ncbi:major histocompatibility complex class I-related gene protein-like [Eucyclogobius newberryi]|uniref:major histocompatibility complex class I-related gene protein-like n=1 Tax=Eucyclogobius newberryi TaxID=166745 RepID=UPI003B58E592